MFLDQPFILHFALAIILGALIGSERERIQQRLNIHEFGGIRSFIFIAIAGFFASFLGQQLGNWFIGLMFGIVVIFIIIGYIHKAFREGKPGITSELGAVMTFIVGILCYFDASTATIAGIVTAVVLSIKEPLHNFVQKIKDEEFFATLEFALLAFVILPLLPNRTIDPWNVINPYEVWLLVVFMLGISFIGYILNRVIGTGKGIVLTGLIGGIVSSTAVTQSMSVRSKTAPRYHSILAAATIGASCIMFIRVLIVVATLNRNLLPSLVWPIGGMLLAIAITVVWNIRNLKKGESSGQEQETIIKESPFKLVPAIKFGCFFVFILLVSEWAKAYLGTGGIYLTAVLTGFVDIDPFMLSMIKISVDDPAFLPIASKAIPVAVMSNMVVKTVIPFIFGNREFALRVLKSFAIVIAVGLVIIVLT